jgi:crossover junction endodeoxyribonuclease RusA
VKLAPRSQIRVELPLPPSTNNLFATVNGKRVKTKKYRDWLKACEAPLVELKKPEPGLLRVRVEVHGKVNPQRDLDNMLKPIGDALVANGIIAGDTVEHVAGWAVDFFRDSFDPVVHVSLERLDFRTDCCT